MVKMIKDGVIRNRIIYFILLISSITASWTVVPRIHRIYMFHILIIVYTANLFINMFEKNRIKFPKLKIINILSFIFVWYLYMALSFFWAESTTDYIKTFVIYSLVFYFVLIVILNNTSVKQLNKTINIVGVLLLGAILIGILESKTNFRLWGSPYMRNDFSMYNINSITSMMTRPTVYFPNPNNLGTFVMFAVAFLTSFILYGKSTLKHSVVLFATLILLYLTNSRANWLGVIMIFAVFVLMKFRLNIRDKKVRKLLLVFSTTVLLVAFLIIIVPRTSRIIDRVIYKVESSLNMVTSLDFSASTDNSARVRGILMRTAFEIIKEKPLGVGAGNTSYFLGLAQQTGNLSIHNWFLEIWVDFGFQFFILYMVYYGVLNIFLYKCMVDERANRELRAIAGGCFMSHVGFIIGMISPSGITYFLPYWLLTGLSFAAINVHRLNMKNGDIRLN